MLVNQGMNKSALIAAVAGTLLQWYDFSLFGFLAPVIARVFFATDNPLIALLNTFAIFAVGYCLAPLGAVLFGYIGDRYGRKHALRLSIILMTVPTTAIAFLPGVASWGIVSPILLLLCRLIQGLVASAEFAGSAIFMVEHAPATRRSFYACLPSICYSLGMIVGGMVAAWVSGAQHSDDYWRIAFLLASVGGLLVWYVRHRVAETEVFSTVKQAKRIVSRPLLAAWCNCRREMGQTLALAGFIGVLSFGCYVYMPTFLHVEVGMPLSKALWQVSIALWVDVLTEPLFAFWADRVGRRRMMLWGSGLMLVCLWPLVVLLMQGGGASLAALCGFSLLIAFTFAPSNALLALLYAPEYRFSGYATAFNLGMSLLGGTTPLVLTYLVSVSSPQLALLGYFATAILLGGIALLTLKSAR